MSISSYILLVVVVFFALVLHAIHREDKRQAERRKQNVPVAVERRQAQRRRKSLASLLAWVLRLSKAGRPR